VLTARVQEVTVYTATDGVRVTTYNPFVGWEGFRVCLLTRKIQCTCSGSAYRVATVIAEIRGIPDIHSF
jgi:hypothetical protein